MSGCHWMLTQLRSNSAMMIRSTIITRTQQISAQKSSYAISPDDNKPNFGKLIENLIVKYFPLV